MTRAGDYAVRALIHLAMFAPGRCVSQPELARATGVPTPFVAKVLQRLSASELVCSARGVRGGYAITDTGRKASMLDVIEAIDGPVLLNTCLNAETPCSRADWCPAHLVWRDAQRRFTAVLARASIARLARRAKSQARMACGGCGVSPLSPVTSALSLNSGPSITSGGSVPSVPRGSAIDEP